MKTLRLVSRLAGLALAAGLLALPAAAAGRSDDALSLVPPDAAAVCVVRWNELRSSPLGARILSQSDHITADGDAARFMAEARLNPKEDVDVVVIAGSPSPSGAGSASGLVLFEGRFDADRLATAMAARGATRKSVPGGDYYLLPDKASEPHGRPGAVAFASARLALGGDEASVVAALARREAGGSDFASRATVGREYRRINPDASAWALVDVKRFPLGSRARVNAEGQAGELLGAMKSVTFVALQASVKGDALDLSAIGVTDNDETRQLLEDSLRGVLAMWRLAAQEKAPEAVSAIRRFQVGNDGQAVTIKGTLTGDTLRALSEKHAAR